MILEEIFSPVISTKIPSPDADNKNGKERSLNIYLCVCEDIGFFFGSAVWITVTIHYNATQYAVSRRTLKV